MKLLQAFVCHKFFCIHFWIPEVEIFYLLFCEIGSYARSQNPLLKPPQHWCCICTTTSTNSWNDGSESGAPSRHMLSCHRELTYSYKIFELFLRVSLFDDSCDFWVSLLCGRTEEWRQRTGLLMTGGQASSRLRKVPTTATSFYSWILPVHLTKLHEGTEEDAHLHWDSLVQASHESVLILDSFQEPTRVCCQYVHLW